MDGGEVNINELIEHLQDLQSEHGDSIEVRLAMQPHWPMEYSIGSVGAAANHGIIAPVIYIGEGQQLGYLSMAASIAVGWREEEDNEPETCPRSEAEQHHGMYVCRNCGAATESPYIVQWCSACGRNLGWEPAPVMQARRLRVRGLSGQHIGRQR